MPTTVKLYDSNGRLLYTMKRAIGAGQGGSSVFIDGNMSIKKSNAGAVELHKALLEEPTTRDRVMPLHAFHQQSPRLWAQFGRSKRFMLVKVMPRADETQQRQASQADVQLIQMVMRRVFHDYGIPTSDNFYDMDWAKRANTLNGRFHDFEKNTTGTLTELSVPPQVADRLAGQVFNDWESDSSSSSGDSLLGSEDELMTPALFEDWNE